MECSFLKIWHGYGAPVVVGAGESPVHGKGEQVIYFCNIKEVCEMQKAELILTKLYQKKI
jgi:hypothetical protein